MIPQLIQRGKFITREEKVGLDSIVRFDYMGSAEFEFGELPKSLQRIRGEFNEYVYLDVPVTADKGDSKTVTVFCKNSQKALMKAYLQDLVSNKHRLKEYSDFDNFINPRHFQCRTDFWWDIKNDLMFWKKDNEFEAKFKIAIKPKE